MNQRQRSGRNNKKEDTCTCLPAAINLTLSRSFSFIFFFLILFYTVRLDAELCLQHADPTPGNDQPPDTPSPGPGGPQSSAPPPHLSISLPSDVVGELGWHADTRNTTTWKTLESANTFGSGSVPVAAKVIHPIQRTSSMSFPTLTPFFISLWVC
jgi:hypothetical protein